MPYPKFLLALSCGAIPLGFTFATAGHLGREAPVLIILLCAVAPVVLWAVIRWRIASAKG